MPTKQAPQGVGSMLLGEMYVCFFPQNFRGGKKNIPFFEQRCEVHIFLRCQRQQKSTGPSPALNLWKASQLQVPDPVV